MQCIVQARMSSSRLPQKTLTPINGISLLERVILRISKSNQINRIIVATSDQSSDNPIQEFCESEKVLCHRSSLNNVYKRYVDTLESFPASNFVRICADSPLIDSNLIDLAIMEFKIGNYDLVTNTFPRTFPKGQSVEVIRTSVFLEAYGEISSPEQLEHITKFFYDNSKEFNIHNVTHEKDCSSFNHCIDTPDDLVRIENLLKERENKTSWIDFL